MFTQCLNNAYIDYGFKIFLQKAIILCDKMTHYSIILYKNCLNYSAGNELPTLLRYKKRLPQSKLISRNAHLLLTSVHLS